MHKIIPGSARALSEEETAFAVKNAENMNKPFEQRYQESLAQCDDELKAFEEMIAKSLE